MRQARALGAFEPGSHAQVDRNQAGPSENRWDRIAESRGVATLQLQGVAALYWWAVSLLIKPFG